MQKSYSLALGGGAAKGLCHIGVYKYLEEKYIPIKEVSGTSMGAIVGACVALGMSSKEITEIAKSINLFKLTDLSFKRGLISGKKIYKFLDEVFGEKEFYDTVIPLKIITTDINTGEKIVFTTGKIADAVRASISLPMIFDTIESGKKVLIDGGFKSNLPVLELDGNVIIAVSAVRDNGKEIKTYRNFFKFRLKKLFFGYNSEVIKKLVLVTMSTIEDLSLEIAKYKGKEIILIAPDLGEFEFHDFKKVDELVKKGYEEAFNKLSNL